MFEIEARQRFLLSIDIKESVVEIIGDTEYLKNSKDRED